MWSVKLMNGLMISECDSQIKKIENISCEEISSNWNFHIPHVILKKLVHVNRRWVYVRVHCNYNKS